MLPNNRYGFGPAGSLHAIGMLALLAVLSVARGQNAPPTDSLPQKPASDSASAEASAPPSTPPNAATSPSNTPLPAPEMIEVPEGQESLPAQGPKLRLDLPQYVAPILPLPHLPGGGLFLGPQIFIKEFRFQGNTVYSDDTLAQLLEKYRGRYVTAEELEEARQILTLFYVNNGFINSGAVLPDQDLKGGVVLFQIVEGKLTAVNIKGNNWFQTWWLRNEVREAAGEPLNFNHLKQGLQLLRENPTIAQVNAELQPGGAPGESLLNMEVKDTQPFRASLEFANDRPPSVGSEIVNLHLADLNLTGNNDALELTYGIAQSNRESVEFSVLDNIDGSYTFPVTPFHTTVQLRASKSDSSLVEAPFNTLNITSELTQFGATLRQQIYQTPQQELAAAISVDDRHSQTDLFGLPFSLSPGAINGIEDVFALRFINEFVDRSQVHVLSLRSAFSVGLDTLGATAAPVPPNGSFFSWLGQSQYIRRLGTSDDLLVLRLNGQVANQPLLSLEQFELGGSSNIRGYLENQALRDNGVFGSAEVRIPVWEDKDHNPIFAFAPFFDIGAGWNNNPHLRGPAGTPAPSFDAQTVGLPSVGIGLLFTPNKYVSGQLYWGYALNREQLPSGNNLQNYGISFDLVVNAF